MSSSSAPPYTLNPKGMNASYWLARNADTRDTYPALRAAPEQPFDVVVIGAGVVGLTAALNLKRAGKRVAVLEYHKVGSGTSGNSTGHISLHVDSDYSTIEKNFGKEKAAMVLRGQMEACAEIAHNCAELSIPGFEKDIDVFLYAEPGMDMSEVRDEYVSLSHARAERVELLPQMANIGLPFATQLATRLPGSAQFDPYRYCVGLARAVHGGGCAVYEGTRVVDVKDGVPCEVQTEFVMLHAAEVICATHTPLGISILQTAMVPSLSYVMAVRVAEQLPAGLFYDSYEPYHYIRRLDAQNPNILIIGGSDKKTGAGSPAEEECFADLRRYVSQRFKVQEELAHWSAQYFSSADGLPYVGTDPGKQHVWIATGFSGDGLSLGTISALVLTQCILGRQHPLAPVYSSHRFKPIASARQFIEEQLAVAKHIVIDRLTAEKGTFDDLAPGEGRVMKVGSHQAAAYREPNGRLHAHSAVCTHLKCIVKWNASEKTFDCPCHGSRFSTCGSVLEGPALRDLEDLLQDDPMKAAEQPPLPPPRSEGNRPAHP